MNNKIYVGNLTDFITSEMLKENFDALGLEPCLSANVIKDKKSGKSKGFAFVEMTSKQDALEAVRLCRGVELDGKKLIVKLARPQQDSRAAE